MSVGRIYSIALYTLLGSSVVRVVCISVEHEWRPVRHACGCVAVWVWTVDWDVYVATAQLCGYVLMDSQLGCVLYKLPDAGSFVCWLWQHNLPMP